MRCISPISVGGDVKSSVPCGRCYACLRNYQSQWIIRLKEELKVSKNAYFITLTYNDDSIPRDVNGYTYVSKSDVQKFFKRLRKSINHQPIRYYASAEYGPATMRPHYHAIIFNLPTIDEYDTRKLIADAWTLNNKPLGFITAENVNENRIAYVTGYTMDKYKNVESDKKVFSLMSKGLGKSYLERKERVQWHYDKPTENMYYPLEDGKRRALPRYYRNKIISSAVTREVLRGINERERLAEIKADREGSVIEFKKNVEVVKHKEAQHIKKSKLKKL